MYKEQGAKCTIIPKIEEDLTIDAVVTEVDLTVSETDGWNERRTYFRSTGLHSQQINYERNLPDERIGPTP